MSRPPVGGFDGDHTHPEREFVVGTNTGIRSWYLVDFEHPLKSMSWDYFWQGRGPHRSRMGRNYSPDSRWSEDYPQIGNPVGFYGYYNLKETYPGYPPSEYSGVYRITGVIEGYGRCVIGSLGFRAEVATILGFTVEGIRKYEREVGWFFGEFDVASHETEKIRAYLDKRYPEVPIFNTQADMLRMIPLSEKPMFTSYDDKDV